jgi:hypothetical protein
VIGILVEDGVLGCAPVEVDGVERGGSDELELLRLSESRSVCGSDSSTSTSSNIRTVRH